MYVSSDAVYSDIKGKINETLPQKNNWDKNKAYNQDEN